MDVPETALCARKQQLMDDLQRALSHIVELGHAQIKALREQDHPRVSELDTALEYSVGEKERFMGALREHRAEHGC